MSIRKNLFHFALLAVVLAGFSACDDEKGTSELPKDEAKSKITQFNSAATDDLQSLTDAEGLQAVQDFFDLVETDDPFGRIGTDKKKISTFFRQKGKDFRKVFVTGKAINGRTQAEGAFDFEANKGVYVWNPELLQFEKTEASNIISILFPTEGSAENNAELQLTAYSEVEIYDEEFQEYFYEPTVLKAALFVNDVKKASIDLAAEWDEYGFPLSAEISVMVTPFTATVSFDVTGSTTSTVSMSLQRDQETLVAISVIVRYDDSSKSEESLTQVEGYVQFRNLKLQGHIDVTASRQQEVDWNDVFHLALYNEDQKLGDIVFVVENEEAVPYLEYADGSKEKLETVLQPVVDEVRQLTEDLDNNG